MAHTSRIIPVTLNTYAPRPWRVVKERTYHYVDAANGQMVAKLGPSAVDREMAEMIVAAVNARELELK